MSACGAVSQSHDVEFNALEGSLNMMSKVLNDVLDLCVSCDGGFFSFLLIEYYSHRMDSGRFESFNKVPRPSHHFVLCTHPVSLIALRLSSSHGIALHTSTT